MRPQYKRGHPGVEKVIRSIARFYKLKKAELMATDETALEISVREAVVFMAATAFDTISASRDCIARVYVRGQIPVVFFPDPDELLTQPICLRLEFEADKDALGFLQVLNIIKEPKIKMEWEKSDEVH